MIISNSVSQAQRQQKFGLEVRLESKSIEQNPAVKSAIEALRQTKGADDTVITIFQPKKDSFKTLNGIIEPSPELQAKLKKSQKMSSATVLERARTEHVDIHIPVADMNNEATRKEFTSKNISGYEQYVKQLGGIK